MMDDLTLAALGRQFVELAIQREQLIRHATALQAKLDELTKPKPEAAEGG